MVILAEFRPKLMLFGPVSLCFNKENSGYFVKINVNARYWCLFFSVHLQQFSVHLISFL